MSDADTADHAAEAKARRDALEAAHQKVSSEVGVVIDHLRNNRTTENEARDLGEAARRSLVDHSTAKSLGRGNAS